MSYHFSSKASLAREVVESQYQQWDDILRRIRADGYTGIDAMLLVAFVVARRFRDDVLVRAGIRLQHDAGLNAVELPTPFVGWMDTTRALLAEAQAAGRVPSTLDIASAAEVLVAAFTGVQQVAHRLTKAEDIDERVQRYWLLLLPGLGVEDGASLVSELAIASKTY